MEYSCELLIIGAGPAGLAAAQYGARANLKTIVIEEMAAGGQSLLIDQLENYPGILEPVSGYDLAESMRVQAERFGAEFVSASVESVEKEGSRFVVKAGGDRFAAEAVIVATGAKHRHLGVPGEDTFAGRGVSYCATCDGPFFKGKRIDRLPASEVARLGLARTFQNLQVCLNMTALENVMVGAHLRLDRNVLKAAFRWPSLRRADQALHQEAAELMRFVGLEHALEARADAMSYGALKRLEIARALAMKPRLLFLDEPAAGLNPRETLEIDELIRKVAASGVTVVLVEHDMKMVMSLSDRILVLDYGKKLAEGTAAEIRQDPAVIAAYLGAGAAGETS